MISVVNIFVQVSSVAPDGLAARTGNVTEGDHIISINQTDTTIITEAEIKVLSLHTYGCSASSSVHRLHFASHRPSNLVSLMRRRYLAAKLAAPPTVCTRSHASDHSHREHTCTRTLTPTCLCSGSSPELRVFKLRKPQDSGLGMRVCTQLSHCYILMSLFAPAAHTSCGQPDFC